MLWGWFDPLFPRKYLDATTDAYLTRSTLRASEISESRNNAPILTSKKCY